jgi:D-serine deaminase-like pyridoxal phosphate-dependent protein
VAIEVNIGMNRAGVEPGAPTVALAREIARRPALRFAGVFGWESHATTIADRAEKERLVREAVAALVASARACDAAWNAGRHRDLRRHRHVSVLHRAAGRHRSPGGRRDLQRHALPHALPPSISRRR